MVGIINDIIGWDVNNWSKALNYWDNKLTIDYSDCYSLELGSGSNGGLSLWLALKGSNVICSGYKEVAEEVKNIHKKYGVSKLIKYQKPPINVYDAISKFEKYNEAQFPDHEWAHLKTIRKYRKYYKTGKYGWYKLNYYSPAPSFGNIMKTYTLHPKADIFGTSDKWLRVLSVREVMSIMGFPESFRFPKHMGHTIKYQMIADVISPKFSIACAKTISELL